MFPFPRKSLYDKGRERSPGMSVAKQLKNTSSDHPNHESILRSGRNVVADSDNLDENAVVFDQEGCVMLRVGDAMKARELFADALKNFSEDNYLGMARAKAHSALAHVSDNRNNDVALAKKLIDEALEYHDLDIEARVNSSDAQVKGVRHKSITENSYLPRVMIAAQDDADGTYKQSLLEFCYTHDDAIAPLEYLDAVDFALRCDVSPAQHLLLQLRKAELELAPYDKKALPIKAAIRLGEIAITSNIRTSKWASSKALGFAISAAQRAQQAIDSRQ